MKATVLFILIIFLVPAVPVWCVDDDGGDEDDYDILCQDYDCDQDECDSTEDCQYGTLPNVCNCCLVCAKGPGESCNGMFSYAGFCGTGLVCQRHPKYYQLPGVCVHEETTTENSEAGVSVNSRSIEIPEDYD